MYTKTFLLHFRKNLKKWRYGEIQERKRNGSTEYEIEKVKQTR